MHRLCAATALWAVALATGALAPASSSASITFGSDLKAPILQGFTDTCDLSTAPCTQVLTGVRRANKFPAASPPTASSSASGSRARPPTW